MSTVISSTKASRRLHGWIAQVHEPYIGILQNERSAPLWGASSTSGGFAFLQRQKLGNELADVFEIGNIDQIPFFMLLLFAPLLPCLFLHLPDFRPDVRQFRFHCIQFVDDGIYGIVIVFHEIQIPQQNLMFFPFGFKLLMQNRQIVHVEPSLHILLFLLCILYIHCVNN